MAIDRGSLNKRIFVIGGVAAVCLLILLVGLWRWSAPDVTSGSVRDRVGKVARIVSKRPIGAQRSLMTAAKDVSPTVRKAALVGLAQMDLINTQSRPVIENAVQDEDPTVRAIAAENLGHFNDAQATTTLTELAYSPSENKSVRRAALRGLVPCDDPRAIVAMVELAANSSAPVAVRLQAAKSALAKAGGRLLPGRTPANDALWRDEIQRMKNDQRIRRAYAAAGVAIVDHPEDIVIPNLHGPRHLPAGGPTSIMKPGELMQETKR